MKEILGNNLEQFFNNNVSANRTYKGNEYEVWEVTNATFDIMCNMTEEEFVRLAGEDAWWRSAQGSNLGTPDNAHVYLNGYKVLGWSGEKWRMFEDDWIEEYGEDYGGFEIHSESLTHYISDVFNISSPRNVCAIAVDLAKYNNMTMGELFNKCEG